MHILKVVTIYLMKKFINIYYMNIVKINNPIEIFEKLQQFDIPIGLKKELSKNKIQKSVVISNEAIGIVPNNLIKQIQ